MDLGTKFCSGDRINICTMLNPSSHLIWITVGKH